MQNLCFASNIRLTNKIIFPCELFFSRKNVTDLAIFCFIGVCMDIGQFEFFPMDLVDEGKHVAS